MIMSTAPKQQPQLEHTFTLQLTNTGHTVIKDEKQFWMRVRQNDMVRFVLDDNNVPKLDGARLEVSFMPTDGSKVLPLGVDKITSTEFHPVTNETREFLAHCTIITADGTRHEYHIDGGH